MDDPMVMAAEAYGVWTCEYCHTPHYGDVDICSVCGHTFNESVEHATTMLEAQDMNVTFVKNPAKHTRWVQAHWDVFHGKRQVGEIFIEEKPNGMMPLAAQDLTSGFVNIKRVHLCNACEKQQRDKMDRVVTNAFMLLRKSMGWEVDDG